MKPGDVVRWTFVQGDGQRKMRPAVILGAVPPFNDWLVCAVSSQVQRAVKDLDVVIDARHPDFHRTGLRMESVVRVAQLTTLPDRVVQGAMAKSRRARSARSRSACGSGWAEDPASRTSPPDATPGIRPLGQRPPTEWSVACIRRS
ncbi:MAG: type II toxin-antitoxin system PemK/MazF family toxin [Flavobacteriales bacterium]|nr:type II toxin-antitoxin system PemK/MazF family toxin [Flavobacteriales bacterium]